MGDVEALQAQDVLAPPRQVVGDGAPHAADAGDDDVEAAGHSLGVMILERGLAASSSFTSASATSVAEPGRSSSSLQDQPSR